MLFCQSETESFCNWKFPRCGETSRCCYCGLFCVFLFSSYKRYFYCHDITGITRWDYPEGPEPEDRTDEQQHRDVADTVALNTIEYQTTLPSSTKELEGQAFQAEMFPEEPLPPGVDPPLPGALSANILALAGCPPPPPPMTPPDTAGSDEVVGTDEELKVENDSNQTSGLPVGSPTSDEEQQPGSMVLDPDLELSENVVEISAAPMLNWPTSPQSTNPSGIVEIECTEVNSPTADVTATLSPARGSSPTTSSAIEDSTTHQHRERRRKKEKVDLD